jgi:predicted nuclease of predicted toxin-antitoxin system
MRFLIDAQLPSALARWLAEGYVAEHVGDRGLSTASDSAIWNFALAGAM